MGPQVQPKCFRHLQHMRNNWELRKRGYLIRFGHTNALLLKKRTLNGHFSFPAQTDPYGYIHKLITIKTQVIEGLTEDRRSYWDRLWMCSDRRSGPQHPLIYRWEAINQEKCKGKDITLERKKHIWCDWTVKWRLQELLQLMAFNNVRQLSMMMMMMIVKI